jgi:hypothetical protein
MVSTSDRFIMTARAPRVQRSSYYSIAVLAAVFALPNASRAGPTDCRNGRASEMAVGSNFACARVADNVRCWGGGKGWEGYNVGWSTPTPMVGLRGATSLKANGSIICGLTREGRIKCWDIRGAEADGAESLNGSGDLVSGTLPEVPLPDIRHVHAFWLDRALFAQLTDGSVVRWDWVKPWANDRDGLSENEVVNKKALESKLAHMPELRGMERVVGGREWGCGWRKTGRPHCWGAGPWPSGWNIGKDYLAMTIAPHLAGAVDLVEGGDGNLYEVQKNGRIRSWRAVPVTLSRWEIKEEEFPDSMRTGQVVMGHGHDTCAVVAGKVKCWSEARRAPSELNGLDGVVQVGFGDAHGCALLRDGSIRCWGANNLGQLGDGSTAASDGQVIVSWCRKHGEPLDYWPPPGVELIVRMERNGALTGCPEYEISVYRDGTVIYHGKNNVKVYSPRRKTIAPSQAAAHTPVRSVKVFPAEDAEWRRKFIIGYAEHGPNEVTEIEQPHGTRMERLRFTRAQCGVPEALIRYGDELEDLAKEWTGAPTPECVAWRQKAVCMSRGDGDISPMRDSGLK